MKKTIRMFTILWVVIMGLATFASAQEIVPRGYKAPEVATAPAPTPPPETVEATPTPVATPAPVATATPTQVAAPVATPPITSRAAVTHKPEEESIWSWMGSIVVTILKMAIAIGVVVFVGFMVYKHHIKPKKNTTIGLDLRKDEPEGGRWAGKVVLFALGLASLAQPLQAAQAPCEIRSISSGGVVVKEQAPASIVIGVRNCPNVSSVEVATGATDIAFTEVMRTTGNRLTAKVSAEASAETGPTTIRLTLEDGTEVSSPRSVYLLVLDMQVAQVRKDLTATTAQLRAKVDGLEKKVEAVNGTTIRNDRKIETGLPKADIEKIVDARVDEKIDDKMKALHALILAHAAEQARFEAQATKNIGLLAKNQQDLGNTWVNKGGFKGLLGGKKNLNLAVAITAKKIQDELARQARAKQNAYAPVDNSQDNIR